MIRAWVTTAALVSSVVVVVSMGLLAIFDEFSGIPVGVQQAVSAVLVLLVVWRVGRAGVKLSEAELAIRGIFRDTRLPWESIRDVRVTEGSAALGRTSLPCVLPSDRKHEVACLAGYALRGENTRVVEQTEVVRNF